MLLMISTKLIGRFLPVFVAACIAIAFALLGFRIGMGRWEISSWLEEPSIIIFDILATAWPFFFIACIPWLGTGSATGRCRYRRAVYLGLALTLLGEIALLLSLMLCPSECFGRDIGYHLVVVLFMLPFVILFLMVAILTIPSWLFERGTRT